MKIFKMILDVVLVVGISSVASAQEPGMMRPDQDERPQTSADYSQGAEIFNLNCSRCHANGGNIIVPSLPLRGSGKLSDFKTFLTFIRNPRMPDGSEGVMPAFPERQISDNEAKTLYLYITSSQSTGIPSGGHGMGPGMMGRGYGGYYCPYCGQWMGPGMMGGWGPGYGPRYPQQQYQQYPQPQKPLTEKDAREIVENYLRNMRNPNLKIGKMKDAGSAFEADIVTKDDSLVDKVLIDKSTGWMRSAY